MCPVPLMWSPRLHGAHMTRSMANVLARRAVEWRLSHRWRWAWVLTRLAAAMGRGCPVPLCCEADVPLLSTLVEVKRTIDFYEASKDERWCLYLGKFDANTL